VSIIRNNLELHLRLTLCNDVTRREILSGN
jgi:hypothetical protein